MKIDVTGRRVEISEALRSHVDKKVGKLDRFLPGIMDAKVELDYEETKSREQRFVARAIVNIKKTVITAEERAEDVFVAVDRVAEDLNRQIEHYKGRRYWSRPTGSIRQQEVEATVGPADEEDRDVGGRLVKVKRFEVSPMSVEQATTQMETLRHDFFIFINPESGDVNILYKRKDGNLGLIQPEMAESFGARTPVR